MLKLKKRQILRANNETNSYPNPSDVNDTFNSRATYAEIQPTNSFHKKSVRGIKMMILKSAKQVE